ncbi:MULTISPECIES: MlaE family ABC transporter permease [Bradyrhizobium]|uniref:Phospholipid/cholesterol/gamma-HCH transport system permease protein n=2 Tax=Bradyrhizobium TaxID=374 RepID=A0ABY0QG74_9BRAD|nr:MULTISPECIES: ABC transporter permease [Bradyrhizobium]SDK27452.1 phospholipid/cholesterol/gamma-HCH transport system permease protein [Bradyrhizobium ottawaense]SEE42804.1 phospholipid/cholesterol/gamma-HCH transport system permease protein [Bradyrhizobium lablabi]SHM41595.1 phospholipid/cholesterol/gamma-HCH transport system permease protein [Bradyrhizobium lablabi]
MTSTPLLTATASGDTLELRPGGSWTAVNAAALERMSSDVTPQLDQAPSVKVDMTGLRELDTLGAWMLEKMSRRVTSVGHRADVVGVADNYAGLIEEVHQVNRHNAAAVRPLNPVVLKLNDIGRSAISATGDVGAFLQMLGSLFMALIGVLRRPRSLRITSLVYQLYRVGWQAIPIVVLITFLIGAIIAQQGFFHFRKFGADSYVVDMVGILVLRELGVLIVAIMVAGRSGSAYTAELGSMKMREEIDALSTMGLDPVEVLILPRVIALVLALPILSFIGSLAALYGGGLVAQFYGGMGPQIYLARLHDAVSVTHFEVGILKAPFMALVIGIVACSEGLRVKGSAESLGKQTTTSVVKSIFLVIVLDGLFAIFFASIGM